MTERASDYLYSWNSPAAECLKHVRIEDDTRDALQSAYVTRPSLKDRMELLELAVRIGVQFSFVGFPAASAREQFECRELVEYIASRHLPITPVLMSRAMADDLDPILAIEPPYRSLVLVDLYISTSPLRMKVEGWDLDAMLGGIRQVAKIAAAHQLRFRIAFEDSTRTPPASLTRAVRAAVALGPECIVLNDTVGDCDPSGAARTTAFVKDLVYEAARPIELAWHGHNDKGLSLANAVAAANAGATIISGTFTGVGELTGNTPIEQLIYFLVEAGNRMYDVRQLVPMCAFFSKSIDAAVPPQQPLVGDQAFATSTGTHAAAVLKARQLGEEFEDHIYSAVSAQRLGRQQRILIGPNSGRSSIRAILGDRSISYSEEVISGVLDYCKQQNRCLRNDEELAAVVASLNH